MNNKIAIDPPKTILSYSNRDLICFITGILFMSSDFVRGILRTIIPSFPNKEQWVYGIQDFIMLILYSLSMICWHGRSRRKLRVWPVYMLTIGAMLFSLVFYPEYQSWYTHEEYGLVFRFAHLTSAFLGLYVISLFDNVDRLMTMVVWGCRVNFIWQIYGYWSFLQRGYWTAYMGNGQLAHLNYGLNYGYQVVFSAVLFLVLFVYNKKIYDLVCMLIATALVIVCGSRGPLICLAAAIVLLFITKWNNTRSHTRRFFILLILLIAALTVMIIGIPILVNSLMILLGRLKVSGRAIDMLLNGRITYDSGRSRIQAIAFDMIRKGGLFGYGFYGDRYVIGQTWYYGYPHNVFLELLIQFGVLGGGVLSVMLVFFIIRMLVTCRDITWQTLLIVFLCASVKLWLSDSFWYYWPFWGLLGVLMLWKRDRR